MMKEHNKGITLIELLIALALVGLVIALGYSFYSFGTRTFAMGDKQSQVQFDVRMASSFITQEVRNATNVDVIPTPSTFATDYHYIFVKNNRITHYYNSTEAPKTEAIIANVPSDMFRIIQITDSDGKTKNLLAFTIAGINGTQQHEIETEVLLNNLGTKSNASNQAIRYQKP